MLNKKDLQDIGYTFSDDPDQPGFSLWRLEKYEEGSDISFSSFDGDPEMIADASDHALSYFGTTFFRCDNCGTLHTEDLLRPAKNLAQRVDPGGVFPAGECSSCGCLCYIEEIEPAPCWDDVLDFYALDPSFQWKPEDKAKYTALYLEAQQHLDNEADLNQKARAIVKRIAELVKFGEPTEDGSPFSPGDGFADSHECLMGLIDEARLISTH